MKINNTFQDIEPYPFYGGNTYIRSTFGRLYINCFHKKGCLIKLNTWLQSEISI